MTPAPSIQSQQLALGASRFLEVPKLPPFSSHPLLSITRQAHRRIAWAGLLNGEQDLP